MLVFRKIRTAECLCSNCVDAGKYSCKQRRALMTYFVHVGCASPPLGTTSRRKREALTQDRKREGLTKRRKREAKTEKRKLMVTSSCYCAKPMRPGTRSDSGCSTISGNSLFLVFAMLFLKMCGI